MDSIKLKYTYDDTIAGEVIDKSYWDKGNELLYTCQKTPMMSDFSDFPDRKRTTDKDLLLTRNATPYIFIPENNSIYSNVVQKISLKSTYNREYIRYALMVGVDKLTVNGDTIPSWNMNVWNNIDIPLHSLEKQKKIADFLNDKCIQIDKAIEYNKKLIKLYEEVKLNLIESYFNNQTRKIRLKYITERIGDGLHGTPDFDSDGEYYFINGNNIGQENLVIKDTTDRISNMEFKKYKQKELTANTILMTLNGATYGKTSFYNNEKVLLGKSAGYISLQSHINKKLIRYYLMTRIAKEQIDLSLAGSTIANVSLETLRNLVIKLPTESNQFDIVEKIECNEKIINNSKKQRLKLNETLEEYKKSLIYEVVTGKKEV